MNMLWLRSWQQSLPTGYWMEKTRSMNWNWTQKSAEVNQTTFKEFYPVFIEKHGSKQSKNMQVTYKSSFKNISRCKALLNKPLAEITHNLMSDYMDARMKEDKVKPATVNREATLVKCLLNVAVRRGIIAQNPLQGFKLLKESSKRDV